jgi:rare lipoprotein A
LPSIDGFKGRHAGALLAMLLFGGCFPDSKPPPQPEINPDAIEDAVPRYEPYSKYGNPPSYEALGKRYVTLKTTDGYVERGIASWYGNDFHGKRTSSGEPYDMYAMTAAHTTLPIPCYARVTNLETGKGIVVRVNDRGPFEKKRVIDLSKVAAIKLGIAPKGTGLVEVRAISPGSPEEPVLAAKPSPPASEFKPVRGDIFIQVGAYSDPANAERMRLKLEAALVGQSVRIEQNSDSGTLLHRVQAGPYRDVEEVDLQEARIAQLGLETYIIID